MNKCFWLFARETFTLFTSGFSRYRDFLKRCLTHNEELKVKLPILAKYQSNKVKAFLSPTIPTDVCWNFIKRTFSLQSWGSKNLDPHSWSLHRKFRFTFTAGCTATKGGTSQWRRGMKGPRRGISHANCRSHRVSVPMKQRIHGTNDLSTCGDCYGILYR